MLISENNTLLVRLEELKLFLLKQNYPQSLIDDSISGLKDLNRSDLLKLKASIDQYNSLIPYVTNVNPNYPAIFPEI